MDKKQIIAINPGSTSTKIAAFLDEEQLFSLNIKHTAEQLAAFPEMPDQLPFRKDAILKVVDEAGVDITKTDAFSGRCCGLLAMPGGVFEVNQLMYEHGYSAPGSIHPGNLGPIIARDFANQFGGRAFVVYPSSLDELCPYARMTGFADHLRTVRGHPLNQKEVSIRYARSLGKRYDEVNLIVVHMGGGISVSAHKKGKIVDSVDSTRGEGRMAPTRAGGIAAADMVDICFSGKYTKKELLKKIMKTGGWVDHLGTADAIEVEKMIDSGDKYAKLVYESTAYQIGKDIGAMASVLKGQVDGIVLTGGLAYSQRFTALIKEYVSYIAEVAVLPGEFEMEGLAAGALRVLRGEEEALSYTALPCFKGFEEEGYTRLQ